jgi:hypothetical protein
MIHIYDGKSNEYLSRMFYEPLLSYLNRGGQRARMCDDPAAIKDSMVVMHGDLLSPDRILQIKNNENKLVVFDINDSSYFSSAYQGSPETDLIDLIFKISGVPKYNECVDVSIDRSFRILTSGVKYLPDEAYERFKSNQHKIRPLPYVLWNALVPPSPGALPSYSDRSGKVLVRGGNHFWRVVTFFRLVQDGLNDENCAFATDAYFQDWMEERFKYCESCITEYRANRKTLYSSEHDHRHCKSPASWGVSGEMYGGPLFGRNEFGYWNNRCPASFIWLAKEFEKFRGPLDQPKIERALSGKMVAGHEFANQLSRASFYADYKWINTINTPPRFWEAASTGAVNFYPERTDDQYYFPYIEKDVHYLTFPNDLSSFPMPSQSHWEDVSRAAKDLYETFIRGTEYAISNTLLNYMETEILGL